MRLKKLELIGFKSFRDKTVIHFDQGITGIVGPNGCGKSNIVDALLWVMGEMSAKELRGSQMSDVIFAGAEGIPPSGFAEVSLTLENDGGPFPIQYQKHSEIMITRRLYRNGESEYLINKEAARLKDIQEIFMDTGAGTKGFSIIQQGMIGRLIMAKPEEKRALIEEAAGITKFKVRKRESERKLVIVEQNLLRLQDVMSELARQVNSLERQAEKAMKYRELKKELEGLEIKISSFHYRDLVQQFEKLSSELQEKNFTLEKLKSEISSFEAHLESLKLRLLQKQTEWEEQDKNRQKIKESIQNFELNLQKIEWELEDAKKRYLSDEHEIEGEQIRIENLRQSWEEGQSRLHSHRVTVSDIQKELRQKESELKELESRKASLEQQINSKRQRYWSLAQSQNQIELRIQSLRDQINQWNQERSEAQNNIDRLCGSQKPLQFELEELSKRRQGLSTQLSLFKEEEIKLIEKSRKLQEEYSQIQKSWADHHKKLNAIDSRLKTLIEFEKSLEGYQEGSRKALLWLKEKGKTSVIALFEALEVPKELETALALALGDKLEALLLNQQEDIFSLGDELRRKCLGRANVVLIEERGNQRNHSQESVELPFVRLSQVIRVSDQFPSVEDLFSQIGVAPSLEMALDWKKRYPHFSFITNDGDWVDSLGLISFGVSSHETHSALTRKREIREHQELLDLTQKELDEVEKNLRHLQEEIEMIQRDREKNREQIQLAQNQLTEVDRQAHRLQLDLSNLQDAIKRLEQEKERLEEAIQRSKLKEKENLERWQEWSKEKDQIEGEIKVLEDELSQFSLIWSDLHKDVTGLQIREAQLKAELQGLER